MRKWLQEGKISKRSPLKVGNSQEMSQERKDVEKDQEKIEGQLDAKEEEKTGIGTQGQKSNE